MLNRIEQKFGLPPLKEFSDLLTEDKVKQLGLLLARAERLAKDKESIQQVIQLLKLLKELDEKGTITRVSKLLEDLSPLTKGQVAAKLVGKLDQLEKLISVLVEK